MTLDPLPYTDGETALTGLLTRPSGTPRAAILVLPTIMNATPAVENKAKALAEAGYLALIADFYGKRPTGFDEARALARVWKAERFSWYLTNLMHRFPDAGRFDRAMQVAELDYIAGSGAMRTAIAENYAGLPL